MQQESRRSRSGVRLASAIGLLFATLAAGAFLLARADGPVFIFAGGPLRAGEHVELASLDWAELDRMHELEVEIVGAASSRTLWFSVHEGVAYVSCDLDCLGGLLARWPHQIELDDRVVIRIDAKRVEGRLVHVPYGSVEYTLVRAGRNRKYSRDEGALTVTEAAVHNTVIDMGETLTGRSKSAEPGDRLYRVETR